VGKFLGLALLWILCADISAAQQSSLTLPTPSAWATFDWTNASASPLWRSPHWTAGAPQNDPAFEDPLAASAVIDEHVTQARAFTDRSHDDVRYKFQLRDDGVAGCDRLRTWANRVFGNAPLRDATYTARFGDTSDTQLRILDQSSSWIVGTTGIEFACIGSAPVDGDDLQGTLGLLTFRTKTDMVAVIQLSAIRCVPTDPSQPSLTIVLDESRNAIRRADMSLFAQHAIYSPTGIQFTPNADSGVTFFIDRTTGQMTASTPGARHSWNCEHVEIGARRF
jgi:hypothetical protein